MEIRKCAAQLENMSRELDPEKKGIKVALKCSEGVLHVPLTISLLEINLREALRIVTGLGGAAFRVNEEGVVIVDAPGSDMWRPSKLPDLPPSDLPPFLIDETERIPKKAK
jgi:hypothetical protein